MPKRSSKVMVLITVLVIVLIIAAFFIFRTKTSPLPAAVSIDTQGQPTLGKSDAPITLVVFEDLKCENCKRYNTTLFPQIKRDYIDTGKAKYVLINLAFIPGSLPAANAARCLFTQNKKYFFPFIEYIFEHQPPENTDWATISTLIQFAKASVPEAKFDELSNCMIEARHNSFIEDNLKIAAKVMAGQVATPALYVNGHKVESLTFENVKAAIETVQGSQ